MSDTLVVFGSITVLVTLSLFIAGYFRHRNRNNVLEAVRLLTAKGEPIGPELIGALVQDRRPPHADLRKGVLFLSVAVATGIFAVVLGQVTAIRPLLGIASFPALIGLAYIGFHLYAGGKEDK